MVIAIHVWLVLLVVQCAVPMAAETAKPLWWTRRNAITTPSMGYLSSSMYNLSWCCEKQQVDVTLIPQLTGRLL